MDDCNICETLGQVSSSEAGDIFRKFLRGGIRQMICEVMAEEVTELCGPKHRPTDSGFVRAGSSQGRVLVDGQREEIVRPRVRQSDELGTTREINSVAERKLPAATQIEAHVSPTSGSMGCPLGHWNG